MTKAFKWVVCILLVLGAVLAMWLLIKGLNPAVLNPKGIIAHKELSLMTTATLLMLLVVIPVFIMTFTIAWKYREGNTKAKYMPDWDHHNVAEFTWWAVPSAIILTLGVLIWTSSHDLDPYKPLVSDVRPVTVQVVALEWKWLFIYPELGIATVNYLQFPEQTPINFEITADAPMNSFWIPQLGGQVYAMAGMSTRLHLMASEPGSYNGVSANLSGEGFAGMKFVAKATSQAEFDQWVQSVRRSPATLTAAQYSKLAEPSKSHPPTTYALRAQSLYNDITMKYMMPMPDANHHLDAP